MSKAAPLTTSRMDILTLACSFFVWRVDGPWSGKVNARELFVSEADIITPERQGNGFWRTLSKCCGTEVVCYGHTRGA